MFSGPHPAHMRQQMPGHEHVIPPCFHVASMCPTCGKWLGVPSKVLVGRDVVQPPILHCAMQAVDTVDLTVK
eukprot:3055671-Alexandrium_andersonii.AAC.1